MKRGSMSEFMRFTTHPKMSLEHTNLLAARSSHADGLSATHTAENHPAVVDVPATSSDTEFDTKHLRASLGSHAISGGFYTASSQAIRFVLNFGSVALLARLLPPEDFGLVAMVGTVTGFLGIFKEAGLSTATVQ